MSWCDKLAATPTIGIGLVQHFEPVNAITASLTPMFNQWGDGENATFTFGRYEPFQIEFLSKDGYNYGIDPARVFVSFHHRMKIKPVSGGPPIAEFTSHAMPFTQLLPEVSNRLIETCLLACSKRHLTRVGIVSQAAVGLDELPPGIIRLMKYMGRPWKQSSVPFNIHVVGKLEQTTKWADSCIHDIVQPESPDELINMKFDWQRKFSEPKPISEGSLKEIIKEAVETSAKYFEDLAEGNRFDEDIIRADG